MFCQNVKRTVECQQLKVAGIATAVTYEEIVGLNSRDAVYLVCFREGITDCGSLLSSGWVLSSVEGQSEIKKGCQNPKRFD